MFKEDTIAAITTGISNAGVGIIRISGDRACEITDRVFQAENKKKKASNMKSYTAAFGKIYDGDDLIDESILLVMKAPNRFKFPGNGFIRTLFLVASLLPAVAMQVTVYNIMGDLRFIDHLYGYIIMSCGTDVISIYIFIQFMENISVSLDESAIVDGASYWTIYWKIILPLLKPAIITACILKGVVIYNEYYAANLYLISPEIKTMAISLYKFVGPMGSQYNLICAGVIISIIPALIVFLCCQKQIYSGITQGAVKG